jgi:uncharacterized protein (TIGR03437 family)
MKGLTIYVLITCLGVCLQAAGQDGVITTVAGSGGTGPGTGGFSGDGGPATSASLNDPSGIVVDASGNLFIADTSDNLICKVSTRGIITTVAGGGSPIYPSVGDGGPATSASLNYPSGIAVDASGDLFIADTSNNLIRKVSSSGIITTVAGGGNPPYPSDGDGGPATSASLKNPSGIGVDTSGNLFIADTGDNLIRKVSANGIITTVAGGGNPAYPSVGDGGPAISASLSYPGGIAVDASGNLFIADTYDQRIRKVSASGMITTVAGNGSLGFSGDGGPATSASLNHPSDISTDASGNLFITDSFNNRIREVSASIVPAPSIRSGGIVAVDSTVTTIEAGNWASIYGTNLANSTANWTGNFPTLLGGTSVTIDGRAAYLSYFSPGQINFQAPNDMSTGPVPVVVTTASGTSAATVTLAQFAPSFLLFDSKHVTGIIVRSDGSGSQGGGTYDFLGPTGNSLGFATVAAKAGDSVELYAVGLGPTNPPIQAGQAYTRNGAPTTTPVNLLINNLKRTSRLCRIFEFSSLPDQSDCSGRSRNGGCSAPCDRGSSADSVRRGDFA